MTPQEELSYKSDASDGADSSIGIATHGILNVKMIEIDLDPELMNTLCRRGRRRLREIQTACQAVVKLDRVNSILRVYGAEDAIYAVRQHLSHLGGPRKAVSAPVWAELMRTRTHQSTEYAAVAQIQQDSGCRIHIERSHLEVRLFGPDDSITVAERLLEKLSEECTEEVTPLPMGSLSVTVLQSIADSHGVTICVDEEQVVTFGRRTKVKSAVGELASYSDTMCKPQQSMGCSGSMLSAFAGELSPDHRDRSQRAGVVTTRRPPSESSLQVQKPVAKKGVRHTSHSDNSCQHNVCPTCGCGRFCVHCGAPIRQQAVSKSFARVASVPFQGTLHYHDETTCGPSTADSRAVSLESLPVAEVTQQRTALNDPAIPTFSSPALTMPLAQVGVAPASMLPGTMMQQMQGRDSGGQGGPLNNLHNAQDFGQFMMPAGMMVPACMVNMSEQQLAFYPVGTPLLTM